VIPDAEIWRAAMAMLKRYGDDSMIEAAARADQLQEAGDYEAAVTWHRILDAIERLQAKAPAEGEMVLTEERYGGALRKTPRSGCENPDR